MERDINDKKPISKEFNKSASKGAHERAEQQQRELAANRLSEFQARTRQQEFNRNIKHGEFRQNADEVTKSAKLEIKQTREYGDLKHDQFRPNWARGQTRTSQEIAEQSESQRRDLAAQRLEENRSNSPRENFNQAAEHEHDQSMANDNDLSY